MSAPNTNLEEQKNKHSTPLSGMRLVVVFAVVLLVGLTGWMFIQTDGPEGDPGTVLPAAD